MVVWLHGVDSRSVVSLAASQFKDYVPRRDDRSTVARHPRMDESTNQRLERLERECHRLTRQGRRWKLAGCLGLIGAIVLAIGGASQDKPAKSVEAEHFVLRDTDGK